MNSSNIINKYWYPIKDIYTSLTKYCNDNNYKNVLEIGPGICTFPLSTNFVGYNEKIKNYVSVDIDEEPLPFKDKEYDFIYSRHTLEDIQNPNYAMKEIIRTCRSGYIETPSPLVEITKGVDSHINNDKYGGYLHHRYIIWSDIQKSEIHFLPKYSSIIDNLNINTEIVSLLDNPYYWNNYFIWKDNTPTIIMHKNGINLNLNQISYTKLLVDAINTSLNNTNYFLKEYIY